MREAARLQSRFFFEFGRMIYFHRIGVSPRKNSRSMLHAKVSICIVPIHGGHRLLPDTGELCPRYLPGTSKHD